MPKKYKRHPNGNGTVYKMSGSRRKPWRAYLPATEDDIGNFKRKTIGYYETRQEALEALTLYRLAPPPDDNGIKLDELFVRWKDSAYKNISRSSIDGYNAAWKHLSPIRKYKVVDVKTPQIQFCVDEMERVGASYSAIHKVQVLASRLEDYAIQRV